VKLNPSSSFKFRGAALNGVHVLWISHFCKNPTVFQIWIPILCFKMQNIADGYFSSVADFIEAKQDFLQKRAKHRQVAVETLEFSQRLSDIRFQADFLIDGLSGPMETVAAALDNAKDETLTEIACAAHELSMALQSAQKENVVRAVEALRSRFALGKFRNNSFTVAHDSSQSPPRALSTVADLAKALLA
jgi:hypothetical protein